MTLGGGDEARAQQGEQRGEARWPVRLGVVGLVLVLSIVFMAQNNDPVELRFLWFEVSTRVWVGMLATLLVGALLGQAAQALWHRRRRRAGP
jgi:uncharacterized integral membrane protein